MQESPNFDEMYYCLRNGQRRIGKQRPRILVSYSVPCQNMDHLSLFAANYGHEDPLVLWSIAQRHQIHLGFGCAHEFRCERESPWSDIQVEWQDLLHCAVIQGGHRPSLCGGFAFDHMAARDSRWQGFPAAALTLSRILLRRSGDTTRLIVNALVDADSDCDAIYEDAVEYWQTILSRPLSNDAPVPAAPRGDGRPEDARKWQDEVAKAVAVIRSGQLNKVVLARTEEIAVDRPMIDILRTLHESHPGAYLFAFARHGSCFLGASPERLIELKQGRLNTCALAGSTPRAANPEEDERLGQRLLQNGKDIHEHALVVGELRDTLSPFCEQLDMPRSPHLHKLRHIQHLITPIAGRAKDCALLLSMLERLHPSPAVGGSPKAAAIEYIRDHEDLDRGWYAGPVGWIDDRGEGEFIVALRSALLKHEQAYLYAGCGIVDASIPESEYLESCIKMRPMSHALKKESGSPPPVFRPQDEQDITA